MSVAHRFLDGFDANEFLFCRVSEDEICGIGANNRFCFDGGDIGFYCRDLFLFYVADILYQYFCFNAHLH